MNQRYSVLSLILALIITAVMIGDVTPVYAQRKIIKNGKTFIPGYPGREVKWTITQQKPANPTNDPEIAKKVHFWLDVELCDPKDGDDIYFVICAMLNVNKPQVNNPAYRADLTNNTWKCSSTGSQTWYPNYHFGCKRAHLTKANPKLNLFDEVATMTDGFTEDQMAASYVDICRDCPNGIDASCNITGANKWLVPGNGLFPGNPNGTSSWWIQNGGGFRIDPLARRRIWEDLVPTGNWYTMAHMDNVYAATLTGYIDNAPVGSEVTVRFPPSTGGGTQVFTVTQPITSFSFPFNITHDLMLDPDEHIYVSVSHPLEVTFPDVNRTMEFFADVIATNETFFPSGEVLYRPGDWMHGTQLQWIWDTDLPYVVAESLTPDPTDPLYYNLSVTATDPSVMVAAALFRYRVNGVQQPDIAIPFAANPVSGFNVTFADRLGPFTSGSVIDQCKVYLTDEAGNTSETDLPDLIISGVDEALFAGYGLEQNHPNPFGSSTTIGFAIPRREHVRLTIFDANGKQVATLVDEPREAGEYSVEFNIESSVVPDGIYYYRLEAGEFIATKRLIVMKSAEH